MALEAEAHIVCPVHGCKGYVAILKNKLKRLEDELKELEQNQDFQMNSSGDEIILRKRLEDATEFLGKLKTRFGDGIVYDSFIDILKKWRKDRTPAAKVYQEVAYLFHGHPDLLDEFIQFLPPTLANQLHVEGNLKQMLKSSSKL